MSLEQLLLLTFLIGIPLLERLFRAMRARTSRSPADRPSSTASGPTVSRPRAAVSAQEVVTTPSDEPPRSAAPRRPASPPVRHAALDRLEAAERDQAHLRRVRQHGPVRRGPSGQTVRGATKLHRVIARRDLRRGIVLMAILGPCMALEPRNEMRRR
jgi:hypothetical protein